MKLTVKEMYEQSHTIVDVPLDAKLYGDDVFKRYKTFNYDKFARMISTEVATICAKIAWNNEPDGEISNMIKKHFGIEIDD